MILSESYFFHPGFSALSERALANPGLPDGYTLEPVDFNAADGVRLHGLLVKQPASPAVVLYFGGNEFRIGTYGIDLARDFAWAGLSVLMMDYRGYGESQGRPAIKALKDDALAAYDYLATRPDRNGRPIIIHGLSLGSFVATWTAGQRTCAALVLESPATNVRDWVRGQVPWFVRTFVPLHIAPPVLAEDNVKRVANYCGPLLVMTGERDRMTPPWMAERIYQASNSTNKHLLRVPEATHGDVMYQPAAEQTYHHFVYQSLREVSGPQANDSLVLVHESAAIG